MSRHVSSQALPEDEKKIYQVWSMVQSLLVQQKCGRSAS